MKNVIIYFHITFSISLLDILFGVDNIGILRRLYLGESDLKYSLTRVVNSIEPVENYRPS